MNETQQQQVLHWVINLTYDRIKSVQGCVDHED